MVVSILAAIFIQSISGRVWDSQFTEHKPAPGTFGQSAMVVGVIHFHPSYFFPLMAGFVLGLACFKWPARKPPRIIS